MLRKIIISGVIGWDVLASNIKKEFKSFKPDDEVDIEINSPGGQAFEGIEISNAIKAHKGKTNIIITGIAASIGSYIAMAGDSIKAYDDATFMIHNASLFVTGDHRSMRKAANTLESITNLLSKAYSKKTGQSNSEIRNLMDDETLFFGDEIENAGFADEIIQTEKPENREDAVAYHKLAFSDCVNQIKEDEKSKDDIADVAAYFESQTPDVMDKKPEIKNQVKKEGIMDEKEFLEFLAKNPEALAAHGKIVAESKTDFTKSSLEDVLALSESAKAEYDTLIETTKIEASTEVKGGKISQADVKFAVTAMKSYGASVQAIAADFICGESDIKTLKMVVAIADEQKESMKTFYAQNNQPEGTPAGDSPTNQISEEKKAEAEMKKGAAKTAQEIGV